jgi:hypothetical protein
MSDVPDFKSRLTFHPEHEMVDIDLSDCSFGTTAEIDEFYDEVDRRLAETGRRWFFLVNYTNCLIADEVWEHWAARGKLTNIAGSLGSARFGADSRFRQAVRAAASRELFRANHVETRDEALMVLADMRRRRTLTRKDTTEPMLRVSEV